MRFAVTSRKKGSTEEYLPVETDQFDVRIDVKPGTAPIEACISLTAVEDFRGVIRIALLPEGEIKPSARFYLPGFMYGTNRGEAPLVVDSKAPRLRIAGEFPASPWWMIRSDRLSHPCALMYIDGRVTGICASPYYIKTDSGITAWEPGKTGEFCQYAGFGCSLEKNEVWYTLGYENAPRMFIDSHKYADRKELDENCFSIRKGETVTVCLFCFDEKREDERAIHDVLKSVYAKYHESPRRKRSVSETVAEISHAIAEDAWISENHCYSGFVFDRGNHFENRLLPSISWTNGLAAAVPMLACANRLADGGMREQALECIEHIVKHCINEKNDLPFLAEQDGVWSNRGWWYDKQNTPGHAAYLVGQAVYLVLKAYECEKSYGTVHDDWPEFAKRVITKTEQCRNADGEYAYILSDKTGAGMEYDSFSGAWLMAAAAYYSYLTNESEYLEDILRSEKWYHNEYVRHLECYGGPLDIDKNIDSEGILSYIRAVRYIHAMVEKAESFPDLQDISVLKEELLDHLRDALYYEYTFKFCYNSPITVPPLSKTGWSSCGGSITSVTNPHIHPMSSSVMDEMLYYLKYREDSYIRSRLEDTKLWSCQCHNTYDKEFDYGKTGWMSERFCHSEGLLTERYPDGSPASTWFALMPWACGSILEGLTGGVWDEAVVNTDTSKTVTGRTEMLK